jgi:hypothetical protein
MGLDESSQAGNPITFGSSGSPPLTVRLAGSGSIPTQSGRMPRRVIAAVSTQFVFVVNHPVTSIWESISRVKSAAVCSKVLDLLRTQSPLVALPASLEQRSADSAETVLATREGVSARSSTSRQSTSQESAFVVSPSSDAAELSNAASRQQFLLALLEDCSFFAHLVLRCVRAAGCSPGQESAKPGSNFRSTSAIQPEAPPTSSLLAQRSRRSAPTLEAERISPTLQTLWVDMACRHIRTFTPEEKCHEYREDPKHAL